MSDARVTPADVAPAQDNADAQQSEATEAPDWSDLFPDEDPQKVREALDNSRKWEKRAKENKAAADRAAELERAHMSAEEQAEARVKEAEKRAADLEAANDRKDVAIEFGLSRDDAELLDHLTDPEAMRSLAVRLARKAQEDAAPRRPQPNPAQHEGDSPINDKDAQARAFFGI